MTVMKNLMKPLLLAMNVPKNGNKECKGSRSITFKEPSRSSTIPHDQYEQPTHHNFKDLANCKHAIT